VQGSTPLDHAQQFLIASRDTAGCLPATSDCHEDADSGSRVLVPVDTRWVERSRAIARWCADRLTALLTATLTDELIRGIVKSCGSAQPADHAATFVLKDVREAIDALESALHRAEN
jgi:hypothetical protein